MVNLTVTSTLTGEVLAVYDGICEDEAEFLIGEYDYAECQVEHIDEPSPEVLAQEEELRKHIEANHDRLVADWDKYSLDH